MRKKPVVPRILKITKVEDFKVYCIFNNGELRIIDFNPIFEKWGIKNKKEDFRHPLLNEAVFNTVQLIDNTLGWESVRKKIRLESGKSFDVAFELDPVVLYEKSVPEQEKNRRHSIGRIVKMARKKAGLTQEELAKRSGTTRQYISRIENDRSDIELETLRKIVETGLEKRLSITIK